MASENLFGALTKIILPKGAGKVEARELQILVPACPNLRDPWKLPTDWHLRARPSKRVN
jgi:hypothetical protein